MKVEKGNASPDSGSRVVNAGEGKGRNIPTEKASQSDDKSDEFGVIPSPSLRALSLTCFTVAAIYTKTVYPGLSGGDSGELITTTCKMGVAHPPGYPTYTMLGRLFVLFTGLFSITPAYTMNMLSAALGELQHDHTVYIYINTRARAHVCVYVFVYVFLNVCMSLCLYVCMSVCMYF
jgi:hypothetical protein